MGVERAITLILKILDKKVYGKNVEFRIRVLELLADLNVYVPVLIYVLDTLDLAISLNTLKNTDLKKKDNTKSNELKVRGVKIDSSVLASSSYQISCIERCCDIILKIIERYRGESVYRSFSVIVRQRISSYRGIGAVDGVLGRV